MAAQGAIVAVLAGGSGRRLGSDKPCAELAGIPLICHALAAARGSGLETVVVAKRATRLPPLEERIVIEQAEPQHPLCGVLAALRIALARPRPAAVIAVACDMPFVTAGLLQWLAGLPGAAMARTAGRPQPLLSRWPPTAVEHVQAELHARSPLAAAIAALGPRVVEESELGRFGDPARLCFNVNDSGDLDVAAGWLAC